MSYYTMLGLDKEPFSTSPDPDFFYESAEHHQALLRLLIDIRLKRGFSVILGDIGTGKTTLSRKLFQLLKARKDIIFFMIMDPSTDTETLFIDLLIRSLGLKDEDFEGLNILDYKERLKNFLFKYGVEEKKTIVFLIDEAQKLEAHSLEVLRVLLNYETNDYKLLQLILVGQMELLTKLEPMQNVTDRISLKYVINPMDKQEIKEMIDFRLKQAGYNGRELFTSGAIDKLYTFTLGYPRRVGKICHEALKILMMQKKSIIDEPMIADIARGIQMP